MQTGDTSKEQHEKNLDAAVQSYQTNPTLPKYMGFEDLATFCSLLKNTVATTPELVKEYGYDFFLKPEYKSRYCTIILKNSNFLVILADKKKEIVYSLRDCHEKEQYDFTDLNAIKKHLKDKYFFEDHIVVDGVSIEEFGNIEAVTIEKTFEISKLQDKKIDPDELFALQLLQEDNYLT
jgi:sucrose-6-phosphate hydrolase SacC (GH32 family)